MEDYNIPFVITVKLERKDDVAVQGAKKGKCTHDSNFDMYIALWDANPHTRTSRNRQDPNYQEQTPTYTSFGHISQSLNFPIPVESLMKPLSGPSSTVSPPRQMASGISICTASEQKFYVPQSSTAIFFLKPTQPESRSVGTLSSESRQLWDHCSMYCLRTQRKCGCNRSFSWASRQPNSGFLDPSKGFLRFKRKMGCKNSVSTSQDVHYVHK